jgi:uncharacterized paraquat-inducible protein A
MKVTCQSCNTTFDVPDEYCGRPIKCLNCKQSFAIKSLETKPAVANTDGFLIWISFLIPLAGIIIGSIFVTKSNQAERNTGSACLVAAIMGFFIGIVIIGICYSLGQ